MVICSSKLVRVFVLRVCSHFSRELTIEICFPKKATGLGT